MKRYAYGLGVFVAGFAASYVLIYLYRWEWNRALMSAALLLVAEVALLGAATLDRLKRLEAKIDGSQQPLTMGWGQGPGPVDPSVNVPFAAGIPGTATSPSTVGGPPRFAWLAEPAKSGRYPNGLPRMPEPGDRFGVFIPVIMGAGLALSALAWAVERFARATANRSRDVQAPSGRLSALALPPSGPFDAAAMDARHGLSDDVFGAASGVERRVLLRRRVALTFGALAIAGPGLFLLADLTQSRPDPPSAAAATVLTLEVASNQPVAGVAKRVHRLWETCRDTSNLGLRTSSLVQLDERRYTGIVAPALGEQAQRRFAGCLEDASIDFVQLRITATADVK